MSSNKANNAGRDKYIMYLQPDQDITLKLMFPRS